MRTLCWLPMGHMQYKWLRANMREQDIVKHEQTEVKAQVAVETGKDFDKMVAQAMDHGESNFKSKGQKKLPNPPKDDVIKLNGPRMPRLRRGISTKTPRPSLTSWPRARS